MSGRRAKKRVCILISPSRIDPRNPAGGMSGVWAELSRDFDQFVVLARNTRPVPTVHSQEKVKFVLLPSVGRRQFVFLISSWLLLPVSVGLRPSVILCQSPFHGGLLGFVSSRLAGARLVVEVHGDHYMAWASSSAGMFKRLLARSAGFVLRRADRVRAVNSLQEDQIATTFGVDRGRISVVPYRVDTSRFHPPKDDTAHGYRLLMACSLVSRKRVGVLLEVLAMLPDHFTAAIAGTGELKPELEHTVSRLGLADRIAFLGQLSHDQLAAQMRNADVLLILSDSEAMPRAILEAMASALPIISTDVGVISDVVVDQVHGLYVPIDDPEATATAVRRLLDDDVFYTTLSRNCLDLAMSKYAFAPTMAAYRAILAGPGA